MTRKSSALHLFLFFLLFFMVSVSAGAQRLLTGKVLNTRDEPLEGATVIIKGKPGGTTTNEDGVFNLTTDTSRNQMLEVSFLSYTTRTVRITASNNYTVRLEDAVKGLNDVIIIGYGSTKRKDLTGSVGDVKMKDLEKAPVASFEDALAGRVAGVQVSGVDGQPGSDNNIVIRGGNSITQSNAPLFVIDGFPIENPDNNIINPDDIASIEILKDASSTAIYGARGANGVIMITTKKGKAGTPVLTYNGFVGVQEVIKRQEVMSPYEFVRYQLEVSPGGAPGIYLTNGKDLESYRDVKGIDWQEEVLQTAPVQSHSIALRGGNDKTKYSISGSLFDQQGVIINGGFSRYQGRFQLDHRLSTKFRMGINANYTYTKQYGQVSIVGSDHSNNGNASSYLFYSAWGYRPVTGADNEDQFIDEPFDDGLTSTVELRVNPIQSAKNAYNYVFRNTLYANAFLEYKIIKDLTLRVSGGITRNGALAEKFNNSKTAAGSPVTTYGATYGINGRVNNTLSTSWLNENTLTYNKKFNPDHQLNIVGGFTMQKNMADANGFMAILVPNESLGIAGLDEGTPLENTSSSSYSTLASFLGRANYTFKSKYLFTVSYRADGSSRFAPGNRWGYFPSGGFAWRMGEENFIKRIKVISDAKLRTSYGITGNNRVSDFAYLSVLRQNVASNSANTNSGYYFDNTFFQGTVPTEVGNTNLVWEKTAQLDIGLDLGFLENRISFTADYYYKKTNDLLLNAALPSSMGYLNAYKNIGAVSNRGFEFTLNTTNIQTSRFSWTSSFNIAFNRNKVVELNFDQPSITTRVTSWNGNFNNSLPYIAIPGREVALFYGFVFDGIYQLSDFDQLANGTYVLKPEIPNNGSDRSLIKPGFIRYRDINGDGQVNADDQTVIGNPLPVHIGGFSNNFTYKGFDLNIFFQWSYGNDILNANRIVFEGAEGRTSLNMFKSMESRWSPDNPSNLLPVAGGYGPNVYSSRTIEDGSFLRLKTVAFGYTLPATLLRKMKIKTIRAYLSAQNLITWTNYSGMDPEVSVRHTALTPGFDWSAYPRARTITFGLNVTF